MRIHNRHSIIAYRVSPFSPFSQIKVNFCSFAYQWCNIASTRESRGYINPHLIFDLGRHRSTQDPLSSLTWEDGRARETNCSSILGPSRGKRFCWWYHHQVSLCHACLLCPKHFLHSPGILTLRKYRLCLMWWCASDIHSSHLSLRSSVTPLSCLMQGDTSGPRAWFSLPWRRACDSLHCLWPCLQPGQLQVHCKSTRSDKALHQTYCSTFLLCPDLQKPSTTPSSCLYWEGKGQLHQIDLLRKYILHGHKIVTETLTLQ